MSERIFLCLVVLLVVSVLGHGQTRTNTNVLDYSATIEPDIANKTVRGSVVIRVVPASNVVEFNCGDLTIDSVTEDKLPVEFSVNDHKLRVSLGGRKRGKESEVRYQREIEVRYHGAPRRGIRFFPDRQQVYTVFSTSQWMVCVDDPADKATLTMKLILPAH